MNTWILSYFWLHGALRMPILHARMKEMWQTLVRGTDAGCEILGLSSLRFLLSGW